MLIFNANGKSSFIFVVVLLSPCIFVLACSCSFVAVSTRCPVTSTVCFISVALSFFPALGKRLPLSIESSSENVKLSSICTEIVKIFLLAVSLVVTCIVRSVCVFVTPVVSFTSRTIVLCVLHEIAKKHANNAK